jgi:hypothetical protein
MPTLGDYGTLAGGGYGPRSPQQLMAQKLMEASPAPTANSSQESAAANTLSQGLRGALMPEMYASLNHQGSQTPGWMNWLGNQFKSDQTGMGLSGGVGSLY